MSDQRNAPDGNPQLVTPPTPDKLSAKMLDMLSANMTAILEKSKNADPVFFLEHFLLFDPQSFEIDAIVPMPFDSFWIVCHDNTTRVPLSWYVHFVDGIMTAWSGVAGQRIKNIARFNPHDPSDWSMEGKRHASTLRATAEFLYYRMRQNVDRINNSEQSTSEPPALKRLNVARNKAGKKRLAPFILVGAQRPPEPAPEHQGAGGWQQPPHSRRGHWRQYKSGKRIWIDNYSVHGGTDHGRHYRVAAPCQVGH